MEVANAVLLIFEICSLFVKMIYDLLFTSTVVISQFSPLKCLRAISSSYFPTFKTKMKAILNFLFVAMTTTANNSHWLLVVRKLTSGSCTICMQNVIRYFLTIWKIVGGGGLKWPPTPKQFKMFSKIAKITQQEGVPASTYYEEIVFAITPKVCAPKLHNTQGMCTQTPQHPRYVHPNSSNTRSRAWLVQTAIWPSKPRLLPEVLACPQTLILLRRGKHSEKHVCRIEKLIPPIRHTQAS